ncbi:MAG: NDP-sugar synthase [Pyrinomonadaceae bacterium]|nr:NDP-sugar synthase [Pyrinomonadaceae bacterium]
MQALILAGGKGTRLRPLTVYTPKPIVPFGKRPFLLSQIETLQRAGITDIILSLNYQPGKIEQILEDGTNFGVTLRYLTEPTPMGTAGAFRYASDFLHTTTVVFNGDILTDLDLSTIIEEHKNRKATATIVLTEVENPSAYGLVETDVDGKILRFLEKPNAEEIAKLNINTVNAGVYILEPQVLEMIPVGENYSFEYGLFPDLLERGEAFFAHIAKDAYWLDIGTPQRYLQAHHDLLAGKIKTFQDEPRRGTFESATSAEIDRTSLISDGCVIKSGARVLNSVLGAGVHVEEKAIIENSVIWAHTHVDTCATIENSIVGRSCNIGRYVIAKNAILGDKTSLTDYTIV